MVFSMLFDADASQLWFCASMLECELENLAVWGTGDVRVEWAGECAGTGDRLGIGVGCACVLVVGTIVARPSSLWSDFMFVITVLVFINFSPVVFTGLVKAEFFDKL